MKKMLNAFYGLYLFLFHLRTFDLKILKKKRIVIVGPAGSAFNTGNGKYIDDYDIVVRVNKSALMVDAGKNNADIGTRTDLLFHCFLENMYSGGGNLDFALYEKQGIKYVINPRNELSGLRNTFNFYKKYRSPKITYILPRQFYRNIAADLAGYRPTTGYSALYTLINSEFSELHVIGFTFFKTAYGSGYRDEMKEADAAKKFISEVNLHNPELEFKSFKKLLRANHTKNIILDSELSTIIANDPN